MRTERHTANICGFQMEIEKNLPRLRKACQYSLKVERVAVITLAVAVMILLCTKGVKNSSFVAATGLIAKISVAGGLTSCAAFIVFSRIESDLRIAKEQWEIVGRAEAQGTARRDVIQNLLRVGQD